MVGDTPGGCRLDGDLRGEVRSRGRNVDGEGVDQSQSRWMYGRAVAAI